MSQGMYITTGCLRWIGDILKSYCAFVFGAGIFPHHHFYGGKCVHFDIWNNKISLCQMIWLIFQLWIWLKIKICILFQEKVILNWKTCIFVPTLFRKDFRGLWKLTSMDLCIQVFVETKLKFCTITSNTHFTKTVMVKWLYFCTFILRFVYLHYFVYLFVLFTFEIFIFLIYRMRSSLARKSKLTYNFIPKWVKSPLI